MNNHDMTVREALILLHEGTSRQGPGDDKFSKEILRSIRSSLPSKCIVGDLGCGTGTASLLLAEQLQQPVLCVDTSEEFLATLMDRAVEAKLWHLITPHCADMGKLDPKQCQFDLIWSEGAAYCLTFEGAIRSWRPLLRQGGIAVVSEMSWFDANYPDELYRYWKEAYPEMSDEEGNRIIAERYGFELLAKKRLPTEAWWKNYYNPLLQLMEAHASTESKVLRETIEMTHQEIDLFRRFSDHFGYTFYIMKAV